MKPDYSYEIVDRLPPKTRSLEHVLDEIRRMHPNKWLKFKTQQAGSIRTAIKKYRPAEEHKLWHVETRTIADPGKSYGDTSAYVKFAFPTERD